MRWSIPSGVLDVSRPLLVGILNATPDSFSDGGKFFDAELAAAHALRLIEEGADILDLGGESTRPGAQAVSAEEELRRVLPVLKKIKTACAVPVSIDTTKAEVARACLDEGADIINDVSGLAVSGAALAALVRASGAGLILMHRRGNPVTMQSLAVYGDVAGEVCRELEAALEAAEKFGISREQIVLDPGLGFAKNTEQNFQLLAELERFSELGRPLLIGPSRKSFLAPTPDVPPAERIFGTAAAVAISYLKGARLFRVHDVRAMREVLQICQAAEGVKHVGT